MSKSEMHKRITSFINVPESETVTYEKHFIRALLLQDNKCCSHLAARLFIEDNGPIP